ncbi:MAG TPA: MFS transporter, partial [Actinomycetota bacterium]|nr:MFS transporter [Actinomycetota bacterium]
MSTVEVGPPAERRDVLVRRTTVLLAGAQALLWGAIGVFAAFGPIVGPRLGAGPREAAVLFGVYYLGTAAGARAAGRVMDRLGRRAGLAGGYLVMAVAGVVAAAAVVAGSLGWLRTSFVALGAGVGAALLGRAAVADLYPPERRGRAVGVVVMAGAVGAIGGPPLGAGVHAAAGALG